MRQAWVPAINSNWKKVPAASFCDPDTSIVPASEHCAVRSQADIHHSTSMPSGTNRMIRRYGIDTSVLVQLLTRDPEKDFECCVSKLRALMGE